MNCNPGDLARLVGMSDGNTDRFVCVDRLYAETRARDPGVWWYCTALAEMCVDGTVVRAGAEIIAHDSHLRPIRDPGEDAQDLLLAPLPQQIKETA